MTDTVGTVKPLLCNTKKTPFKARAWRFTLNNYTRIEMMELERKLGTETQDYVFQEETGELGTPHLQGVFRWTNAKCFNTARKFIPRAHIDKCDTWKGAVSYCTKAETRTGETFTNMKIYIPEDIDDEFIKCVPYKYQEEILDIITQKPDPRRIHWYWDPVGNTGKSTFTKHLVLKYKALVLSGKATDMKNAILMMHKKPKIIILDIPRSSYKFLSYAGIEEVKNGCFFSGKYEGGMVVFNKPIVICFANDEPDYDEMSEDRWDVNEICIRS